MDPMTYGQAWCDWLFRCDAASANQYNDAASCALQKDAAISPMLDAPGTTITQAKQIACAAAVTAAACTDRLDELDACQFTGTIGNDAACYLDAQCSSGYCARADGATCGRCADHAALGHDCTERTCAKGLECVDTICLEREPTESQSDAPLTLQLGDDCRDPNALCANSFCNGTGHADPTYTCTAWPAEGDPCSEANASCGGLMTCVSFACTVTLIAPKNACGEPADPIGSR